MSKKKPSKSNPSLSIISANKAENRPKATINKTVESSNISLATKLKKHWWFVGIIAVLSLGVLGSTLKYLDEDAKQELAKRNAATPLKPYEEPLLNSVNPFLPAPLPTATPQLAKEYIYAGSRLLAVEDANANASAPADLAIWRPSTGYWWVMTSSTNQPIGVSWGLSSDKTVQGDYDGDGKTDFSVFRADNPSTPENECANGCNWYIQNSSNGALTAYNFGLTNDQLAPADYDGDGRTDPAVFRNGTWYILRSSDSGMSSQQFGLSSDFPASADYDGDGKADIAVWRASDTNFYAISSSNNNLIVTDFSTSGTQVVSADYDGDGRADHAIRNGADWVIRKSSNNQTETIAWQTASDKAVHNDYDGDGKVDIAVWRDSNGNWYIRKSGSNGALRQEAWGTSGDIPVSAFYRR